MSAEKYGDSVLHAIDQLKSRKARPDIERIAHMMERKHRLSLEETDAVLEKLVEADRVFKVEYKGNTSYRNAAKWKHRKTGVFGTVLNPISKRKKVMTAIKTLTGTADEEHDAKTGVSFREIEKWLDENYEENKLVQNLLTTTLNREVENGRLDKLETGCFIICTSYVSPGRPSSQVGEKRLQPGSGKKGRPKLSKNKKFKKGNESESPEQYKLDARCDFCLQTYETNRQGLPEALLVCKDCDAKAHPSCMDYSKELSRRARMSPWQCMDCKTCCVCEDSDDAVRIENGNGNQQKEEDMLFCDLCDKGYHMKCHDPPLSEKPQGTWICFSCNEDDHSDNDDSNSVDVGGPSCLPTPCDSPITFKDFRYAANGLNGAKSNGVQYPDASNWTIKEVGDYIIEHGFPEQAENFKEQEIDGKSLLLMKRSDVLTGLAIKLGPALKIYHNIVIKLQGGIQ